MAIKEKLNKQFIELDEWIQEVANNQKQTDAEHSNIISGQFEKLKLLKFWTNRNFVESITIDWPAATVVRQNGWKHCSVMNKDIAPILRW